VLLGQLANARLVLSAHPHDNTRFELVPAGEIHQHMADGIS